MTKIVKNGIFKLSIFLKSAYKFWSLYVVHIISILRKETKNSFFFFFENRATFIQTLTAKKSEKGFIIKEKQSIFYDARKLKLKIVPNDH